MVDLTTLGKVSSRYVIAFEPLIYYCNVLGMNAQKFT